MGCNNSTAAPPGAAAKPSNAPKPAAAPAPETAPAASSSSTPAASEPAPASTDDVKVEVAQSGTESAAEDTKKTEELEAAKKAEEDRLAAEKAEQERIEAEEQARKEAEEAEAAAKAAEQEEEEKKKKLKTVKSWRERSKEGEISEEDSIKARITKVNSQEQSVLQKRTSIKSPVVNSPSSQKIDYDHLVKVVLLGDCNGGKTSIQVRYIQDNFRTWYVSTVGTDLKFKTVTVRDSKVKLQVWDTAGKERHIGAAPDFYQKALGYMIVYDITDPVTFANVRTWMKKVEPYYLANILVSVILVGNKCDCEPEERKVTTEEGQALADEYSVKFFETSAKDNINISDSLEFLAGHVVDKLNNNTELYEDFKLSMF